MTKYYFVGTLLPALSFDVPPDISFAELEILLQENLTAKDYEKVRLIRRFFDLLNVKAFWLGEELDPRGVLTSATLEEALISQSGFPDYVYAFMERYPKKEDRLRHFPLLLAQFFQRSEDLNDSFLRRYLNFERELRLVLTAFRAKKLKRDLSVELQYENPEEELIAQLLAQQDAQTYEPPEKYQQLKVLFNKLSEDPLGLQKALDEYRFEKIDELVDIADTFSIERILAYQLQLMIVERWFQLDQAKGIQMIDTIFLKEK